MIPAEFVAVEAIPLNANGKVDRAALWRRRCRVERAHVAPETELESQLAGIWATGVNLEQVSTRESFFDLGGDSLRAVALVGALRAAGFGVAVRDVFVHRTVAALAGHLTARTPPRRPRPSSRRAVLPVDRRRPGRAARRPRGRLPGRPGAARHGRGDPEGPGQVAVPHRALLPGAQWSAVLGRRAAGRRAGHGRTGTRRCVPRSTSPAIRCRCNSCTPGARRRAGDRADRRRRRGAAAGVRRRGAGRGRSSWTSRRRCCGSPPTAPTSGAGGSPSPVSHLVTGGWDLNTLLVELLGCYERRSAGMVPESPEPTAVRYADFVAAELAALKAARTRRTGGASSTGYAGSPRRTAGAAPTTRARACGPGSATRTWTRAARAGSTLECRPSRCCTPRT